MKREVLVKSFKSSVFILILSAFHPLNSWSLPQIDKIIKGEAQISYPDSCTLKIEAQDNTIINYQSFNIQENEKVFINLASSQSRILNRVTTPTLSHLLGTLYCNGLFILVNESGIHIGPQAQINTSSLILSTRDITNQDFLNGNYLFKRLSQQQKDLLLLNEGKINIKQAGFGVLIAGGIQNQGLISVPSGKIALACGDAVKLDVSSDGLISVAILEPVASKVLDYQGNPITTQIHNTGTLEASVITLKAESLPGIFEKAINLEGYVKASRVEQKGGRIILKADNTVTVASDIHSPTLNIEARDVTLEKQPLTLQEQIIIIAQDYIRLATCLNSSSIRLEANEKIDSSPEAIISSTNTTLISNKFGSYTCPLIIHSPNIHIKKITGSIDILETTGIGTSILLRGPPDSWGSVIYPEDSHLILEAQITTLQGKDPIYLYGDITFYNFFLDIPDKEIYFEEGRTYTFRG